MNDILEYFLVVAIPTLAFIALMRVMKAWYPPTPPQTDRLDRLELEITELRSLIIRISESLVKQAEVVHSLASIPAPPQHFVEAHDILSSDLLVQKGDELFLPVSEYWLPLTEDHEVGYKVGKRTIRRKITTNEQG